MKTRIAILAAAALAGGWSFGKDAAEFGFSPDATGKENTAALQRAFDEGGTIEVTKPGNYKIADTVFIGDDTSLICGNGVKFVKSNEGKRFAQVILNKGALTKTWNRNIEITGLEISVNGMDHNDWKVFGLRGHLAFFYAKDVRINRFRCLDLERGQYCVHVCTFEDLVVDDVRIFGWKDGVHLGRGKRFTIRNGVFDTGDDPIALNAHDYSTGNPELGWIEDGVIENCHDLNNPSRRVGYFCRILAGAWCDWREGMEVQQGDSVVSGGKLYRVSMPVDGKTYISKTRPEHAKGQKVLDGINWVWVQDEAIYECGVRNVVFRDCFLRQPRTAFSVHYDFGKYSRSQYPGAKPPKQEGIVFDNVQVLYSESVPFLSIATPVDSLSINNCTFRNGGIRFSSNKAMADYGYGRTQIQINGCRFYAKGDWTLIGNPIEDKPIDLVTTGNMWHSPDFRAKVSDKGVWTVRSDLPGLKGYSGNEVKVFEKKVLGSDAFPPEMRMEGIEEYSTNKLDFALNNGLGMTKGGRIWTSWISGGDGAMSYTAANWSDDGGETWSDVKLAIDGHDNKEFPRTNIIGTFWQDPDGGFHCFTDQSIGHFDNRAGVWVSSCRNPDGDKPEWSKPRRICDGHVINKPIVLKSGEWAFSTYLNAPWDLPKKGMHAFKNLDEGRGAQFWVSKDKGATWERRGVAKFPSNDWFETQLVESSDGKTLYTYGRVHVFPNGGTGPGSGIGLMVSESKDGGRTWSAARKPEGLNNANSRFQIMRLKSGRLLLVKHGELEWAGSWGGARRRLTAYLSEDDGKTWKGGLRLCDNHGSYPDAFQAADGMIYVSNDYGRGEEAEIRVHKFREEDVLAGRFASPGAKRGIVAMRGMASKFNKKRFKK